MNSSVRIFLSTAAGLVTILFSNGCATAPKSTEPKTITSSAAGQSGFLKGTQVVEKPELEPEWSDWVKEHYPDWREHYWVDRGQWGNRGYIVGKPPAEAEPVVEAQLTPLPPAPPSIVESEPPKIETPEKPTKYVVKKGDSLWKIAGKVYGNPLKWPKIYRANQEKIKNPNKIYPNMVLTIPQD